MELLCDFLDEYAAELLENRIRLLVSGRRDRMPEKCLNRLDEVCRKTAENYDRTVIFA